MPKLLVSTIRLLCLILIIILIALSYHDNNHYRNNEIAYVGNVTIGMDSLKAINYLKERLNRINKISGTKIGIKHSDSTGYYFPLYNESFFITIENNRVNRIYFHSDSLSSVEIKVIAKNYRYSRHKLIYYEGDIWTAFQDGKGTYIITRQ